MKIMIKTRKKNPPAGWQWGSVNLQLATRTRLPRGSAAARWIAADSDCDSRGQTSNRPCAGQMDSFFGLAGVRRRRYSECRERPNHPLLRLPDVTKHRLPVP